jgi:hypothetical protein
LCFSYTALSPPTHIAILREAAPDGPPLTGASSMCASLAAKASWIFFTMLWALVDRSK